MIIEIKELIMPALKTNSERLNYLFSAMGRRTLALCCHREVGCPAAPKLLAAGSRGSPER